MTAINPCSPSFVFQVKRILHSLVISKSVDNVSHVLLHFVKHSLVVGYADDHTLMITILHKDECCVPADNCFIQIQPTPEHFIKDIFFRRLIKD